MRPIWSPRRLTSSASVAFRKRSAGSKNSCCFRFSASMPFSMSSTSIRFAPSLRAFARLRTCAAIYQPANSHFAVPFGIRFLSHPHALNRRRNVLLRGDGCVLCTCSPDFRERRLGVPPLVRDTDSTSPGGLLRSGDRPRHGCGAAVPRVGCSAVVAPWATRRKRDAAATTMALTSLRFRDAGHASPHCPTMYCTSPSSTPVAKRYTSASVSPPVADTDDVAAAASWTCVLNPGMIVQGVRLPV